MPLCSSLTHRALVEQRPHPFSPGCRSNTSFLSANTLRPIKRQPQGATCCQVEVQVLQHESVGFDTLFSQFLLAHPWHYQMVVQLSFAANSPLRCCSLCRYNPEWRFVDHNLHLRGAGVSRG